MGRIGFFVLMALFICSPVIAGAQHYLVADRSEYRVVDERTVEVATSGNVYLCGLYGTHAFKENGITEPERKEAKGYFEWLLSNGPLTVFVVKTSPDSFDSCKLEVAGIRVNIRMIQKGYLKADPASLESSDRSEYIQAEETARVNMRGFWLK